MGEDPRSSADRPPSGSDRITPVSLKLKRAEQELWIKWQDGRECVYRSLFLRKNCPCATCRTEREKQSTELLPVLKQPPPQNIRMINAQLVGRYAIQLFWSDGHKTGIFDFKYLRALAADDTDRPKPS